MIAIDASMQILMIDIFVDRTKVRLDFYQFRTVTCCLMVASPIRLVASDDIGITNDSTVPINNGGLPLNIDIQFAELEGTFDPTRNVICDFTIKSLANLFVMCLHSSFMAERRECAIIKLRRLDYYVKLWISKRLLQDYCSKLCFCH